MFGKRNPLIEKVMNIQLDIGEITSVKYHKAGKIAKMQNMEMPLQPERLIVTFVLHPTKESNIKTELILPLENYNGRYLMTGNGGQAGVIVDLEITNAVARGFACANTDMGSSTDPEKVRNSKEIQIDFGHRGTHYATLYSKRIIEAFYGQKIKKSYFLGASTGGQQALMEATRYPQDYDGIIAFSPAYNRIRVHQYLHWIWLAANKNKERLMSIELAEKVKNNIISRYGNVSGSAEGDDFLSYPGKITDSIDQIVAPFKELGLNDQQIEMYRELYQGPVDPITGEQIFPGYPLGNEQAVVIAQKAKDFYPVILLFAQKWAFGKDVDLYHFDFHKDYHTMLDMWSEMMDVKPTLKEFDELGHKLILFTGSTDILIPYTDGMAFYQAIRKAFNDDEEVNRFFKYYHVPGLGHGSGGKTIEEIGCRCGRTGINIDNRHDCLQALVDWVEEGTEPFELIGSGFEKEGSSNCVAQRPVYPYPYETVYNGGDRLKKESFTFKKGDGNY